MQASVQQYIEHHSLFSKQDKLVLGLSGGKDSMALLHFLHVNNYNFVAVHVNFRLRNQESGEDESFVQTFCKQLQIELHISSVDTTLYAKSKNVSIQEAAREIRYTFFEDVRIKLDAQFILTAHHLNDNIETLFYKLLKGTGVKGIRGILPKNEKIVRPMLQTSREEIDTYIFTNKIPYREDSSNESIKYSRNKIRKELTPILNELQPQLNTVFSKHFERWLDIEKMHEESFKILKQKLVKEKQGSSWIAIAKLQKLSFISTFLFEFLNELGFTADDIQNLIQSLSKPESKVFFSKSHRILKDRKYIIITEVNNVSQSHCFLISKSKDSFLWNDENQLNIHHLPKSKLAHINSGKEYAYIDAASIEFPLTLRKWEIGDYFYPQGLYKQNGKPGKKKLSKYFKDVKLTSFEKENIWVLCSGEKIIWVLNHRIDERFQLKESTKTLVKFHFIKKAT